MKKTVNIARYSLLILLSLSTIFPLIWMFYSSFKTNQEFIFSAIALPKAIHWENYVHAWKTAHIGTYFFNSVFVSITAIIFTVVIGALAAFILAKFQFPCKGAISAILVIGMLIPLQSVLVPLFSLMRSLRLLNTHWSLIITYTAFGLPLTIFLMESFIASFPILNFLNNWKEFSFALVFINSEHKKTLPLGLYNFLGAYTTDYAGLMAALMIATIPIFVIYLLLQEQIIKGMTAGAVKG